MLKVNELHVNYGGIKALQGISIDVPDGKIITLIGANGAGKSTTLKAIMNLVRPATGQILFHEKELTGVPTKTIVESGVVLVPEGRRIFPNLTVEENLTLGAYARKNKAEIEEDRQKVFTLFPRMKERLWQKGGTLSGGEQQMLAVGRALMSKPKVLLMDEPSLGLAPLLVRDIISIIKDINKLGVTVLLVEQNAKAALEIADYGYVLETGRITLAGPGRDLLENEDVRKAYLGEER